MQKKWHILCRKESDTHSYKSAPKTEIDYTRAKELYFINFANYMTMKKNGEFEEYCKHRVPKDIECKWGREVKESLLDEICTENNLLQVVQLARVNLPKNEILDAFKLLSVSPQRDRILMAIEQLKSLFEQDFYKRIVELFK